MQVVTIASIAAGIILLGSQTAVEGVQVDLPALVSTVSVSATCTDRSGMVHELVGIKLTGHGADDAMIVLHQGAGTQEQPLASVRGIKLNPVVGKRVRVTGAVVKLDNGTELVGDVAVRDSDGKPIMLTGRTPTGGQAQVPLAECKSIEMTRQTPDKPPIRGRMAD